MKTFLFVLLSLFCSVSDAQPKKMKSENIVKPELLSEKEIGTFPYFSAPDSYQYKEIKTRDFEEKYFFDLAKTVKTIEGKYFKATIFAKSGITFNETFLLSYYKKLIEKYNGQAVYAGKIPDKARKMIDSDDPKFAKDLYDPIPYNYKQFLIKTKEANIWVELIYGINAELVDFTVMREEIKDK